MDVLLILLIGIGLGMQALASPPVDLTDYEGKGTAQKIVKDPKKADSGIPEKEMIYLDNQEGIDSADPSLRQVRISVVGRDRPGRDGRPLLRLNENQRVKFIRESKDHHWTMIEVVSTRRRAWIPTTALIKKE